MSSWHLLSARDSLGVRRALTESLNQAAPFPSELAVPCDFPDYSPVSDTVQPARLGIQTCPRGPSATIKGTPTLFSMLGFFGTPPKTAWTVSVPKSTRLAAYARVTCSNGTLEKSLPKQIVLASATVSCSTLTSPNASKGNMARYETGFPILSPV